MEVRECSLSFGAESPVFQFAIQKLKMKIYRNVILPVVLYGCETWSLTLMDERKLKVCENWVLRRTFGPKTDEVKGSGENYIKRSFMICTLHSIFFA